MIIIKTNNLTKKFKDFTAVDNININVYSGEIYAFLGLNGAGKTTTIKMLACLLKPTSGDALINGLDINTKKDKIKEIVSISPQESAFAPNLNIYQNLVFMGRIYGLTKKQADERAKELIKEFDLTKHEKKKAKNLSGGLKRRLSIAMAIISKPKILFLDEPTLGLDVISRHNLWNEINKIKEYTTIILTTHFLDEAEKLADRVGIISNGKLVIEDSVNNIKEYTHENTLENAFIKLVGEANYENDSIC